MTLTLGFWLADSVCTQALWRTVMGTNTSEFTGDDERPVERVSWDEVQRFLRRLEPFLPGFEAGLPSEAQWEYACWAGNDKPFSFGTQITLEQVNYDGNYPYGGGEKGVYRSKTVAVKSLPSNAWGLYEMHGNVWEWCGDGIRRYTGDAVRDPVGPVDGDQARVVRGGSWSYEARRARSACRGALPPGFAFDARSFRLCLRSIEPGKPPGRPGGRDGASTPPRDEAGLARVKRKLRDWLRPDRKR